LANPVYVIVGLVFIGYTIGVKKSVSLEDVLGELDRIRNGG
jgi:hypothetical protein